MLKIGLTGGVASGKSTVSRIFADNHNIVVIDADVIAHDIVEPGKPAFAKIVDHFGSEVINKEGRLDRARLRQLVFSDSDQRQQLEKILHPIIEQEMRAAAEACQDPYCILAIPLLIETRQQHLIDRILVIDVPVRTQIERLMQRDKVTLQQAEAMLKAQASREERLAAADDVITNTGSIKDLEQQVARLHQKYLHLAAS